MNLSNLIIGTANLTSVYGYKKKKISSSETLKIFKLMNKYKINYVDTAQSYGFSEKILGKFSKGKKIFTKFNIPNDSSNKILSDIIYQINQSLKKLKKKKIEGILIHNSDYFLKNKINQLKIIKLLEKYKKEKKIKKIGFSIYSPNELNSITKILIPDFFQIPVNILDQRFLKKKIIDKINNNKIEIHARSIFLQGKILSKNQFKSKLVNRKINNFHSWCILNNVSRISACINFIRNYKFIDKVIVGIDNQTQLKEIIKVLNNDNYYVPTRFKIDNYKLIDPRKAK